MKFTEDQTKEIGLSEEQVTKVTELTEANEAELKNEWDGKANDDAEAILHGATESIVKLTGVQHEKGQKIKDYLETVPGIYLKGLKNDLETKTKELGEKIKNTKGDDLLKEQHEDLKGKFDLLQQQEAKFKDYEENDYKGLLEKANSDLLGQTNDIAFGSVKPSFPDTVNEYESRGRWKEFETNTLNKYHLKKVDDLWMGVDKENQHKVIPLKDLVSQNKEISELSKGRDLKGLRGEDDKTEITLEGVPFKVLENATPTERQKAIQEYLIGDLKINKMDPEYPKRFEEYNKKILEKKPVKS